MSDTPVPTDPNSGSPAPKNRWYVVAFGVAVVLGAAAFLFLMYRANRLAETDARYARVLAHLGKQLELQHDADARVIDEATGCTSQRMEWEKQRDDAQGRLTRATSGKDAEGKRAIAAKDRVSALQSALNIANKARDVADSKVQDSAANARKLTVTAVTDATTAASRADTARQKADTAEASAKTAHDRAVELAAAEKQLAEATSKRTELERLGAGALPDASDGGSDAALVTSNQLAEAQKAEAAARSQVDSTRKAVDDAEADAKAKREAALAARRDAEAAEATADTSSTSAQRALQELYNALSQRTDAESRKDALSSTLQDADQSLKQTRASLAVANKKYQEAETDVRKLEQATTDGACGLHDGRVDGMLVEPCHDDDPSGTQPRITETRDGLMFHLRVGKSNSCLHRTVSFDELMEASSGSHGDTDERLHELGFDELLLVRDSGTVLYPRETSGDASLAEMQRTAYRDSVLHLFSVGQLKLDGPSMQRNVTVGSSRYRLFVQPIGIAISPEATCEPKTACPPRVVGPSLALVGAVDEGTLARDGLHVEPRLALLLALMAVLGVVALPVAKLWLVGARARFRRVDAVALASAGVALAVLITTACLLPIAYFRLHERQDKALAAQTGELATTLGAHIRLARTTLGDFDARVDAVKNSRENADGWSLDHIGDVENTKSVYHRPCDSCPPSLHTAFVADAEGLQRIKWSAEGFTDRPIAVGYRKYFRRATCGCNGNECVDAFEIVRSATTDSRVLVAARAHAFGDPPWGRDPAERKTRHKGTPVLATEYGLDDLEHVRTPLGMRLLVVDDAGRVMYDSTRNIEPGHDFLEDVDETSRLRALISGSNDDWLDIRYLGTPSRMYVHALEPAPNPTGWKVVALAPSGLVENPVADTVTLTLVTIAVLAVMAIIVIVVVSLVKRARRLATPEIPISTLRPDYQQRFVYVRRTLRLLAGALAFLIASSWHLPFVAAAVVGVATSLLGVVAVRATMTWMTRLLDWIRRIRNHEPVPAAPRSVQALCKWRAKWSQAAMRLPNAYPLFVLGCLAAFVVAPTVVVFGASYDYVVATMVRAEEEHYDGPLASNERVMGVRAGASDDRRRSRPKWASVSGGLGGRELSAWMPHFQPDALATARQHMDSEHEIAERPTPQLRDLSEPYSAGGVFVVVMAILGLLGAWGVRAISRRMLWLDEIDAMARAEVEQAPQPQPKAAWEDSTDDERRVLAQASFEGFLNPQRQNEDIVFRLVTRGLVDAKTLRVNPDMVNFVRRRISDTDLEKWEGEEGPSLWASIRAPLSTAIAALIAAGAAEPVLGGGGSGSGGLPMAAVGIPTLLHIVASVLTKKKPEA